MADPQGNHDHHRHGNDHGRGVLRVLPGGRRSAPLVCRTPPRDELLRAGGMTKRWYIVHAYSTFENKVADSIKEQATAKGLGELFEQVLAPTAEVVEMRRGRKVTSERRFFPGYVLVKMEMTDEAYHLIKNTPKVTGFLGSDNKPIPITEVEATRILQQVQDRKSVE